MTNFLSLFLAHILADFYLQPTSWVLDKRKNSYRSKSLYLHVGLVTILSYLFLAYWSNPLPAIILGILHGLIDIVKLKFDRKGSTIWFVTDQCLHLITILLVSVFLSGKFGTAFEIFHTWLKTPRTLSTAAGLLLCMSPISFLVGLLTKPWRTELEKLAPQADDNLANAGRWIGMSERALIFVFVLTAQFEAIGFLIAAKSLLRFSEKSIGAKIPAAYISKKSEYVLVGTLLSYTCSIGVALLTKIFY